MMHCAREARRLGDAPPAHTLEQVATHARDSIQALNRLADERKMPATRSRRRLGHAIGRAFSAVRLHLLDRLIGAEGSYRATLLGMRHGVDLVRLVHPVAVAAECYELAGWCTEWLEHREPLLQRAVGQLSWFADHPEIPFGEGENAVLQTEQPALQR